MKKILVVYIYGIMLPNYNFGIMGIKILKWRRIIRMAKISMVRLLGDR